MLRTTLAELRAEGACFGGYNKLVSSLINKRINDFSDYYDIDHNEPILLSHIARTNGPDDLVWCLRMFEIDTRDYILLSTDIIGILLPHMNTNNKNNFKIVSDYNKGLADITDIVRVNHNLRTTIEQLSTQIDIANMLHAVTSRTIYSGRSLLYSVIDTMVDMDIYYIKPKIVEILAKFCDDNTFFKAEPNDI
ncbi:MAG: hypothetical protein ACRC3J_05230 [Culicoidibacterales bacterium]